MGQFIQEGPKNIFETIINVDLPFRYLTVNEEDFGDNLEYLQGQALDQINQQAMTAVIKAHTEGGVPNLRFNLPVLSEYYLGKLLFTMETCCSASAYLIGANPFDQPGVESYKRNMNELLKINTKKQTED
jgi:glucose-6-phosphate isomerase